MVVHAIVILVGRGAEVTLAQLLLLHVTRPDFPFNLHNLVIHVLFELFGFFKLLLDDESVVSLHDLLVHELVPSLRVQLVVEVKVVAVRLLGLQR